MKLNFVLNFAKGVTEDAQAGGLDAMNPDTKEEFDQFSEALVKKINQFSKHAEFTAFAEELIKNIALNR